MKKSLCILAGRYDEALQLAKANNLKRNDWTFIPANDYSKLRGLRDYILILTGTFDRVCDRRRLKSEIMKGDCEVVICDVFERLSQLSKYSNPDGFLSEKEKEKSYSVWERRFEKDLSKEAFTKKMNEVFYENTFFSKLLDKDNSTKGEPIKFAAVSLPESNALSFFPNELYCCLCRKQINNWVLDKSDFDRILKLRLRCHGREVVYAINGLEVAKSDFSLRELFLQMLSARPPFEDDRRLLEEAMRKTEDERQINHIKEKKRNIDL